MPSSLHHHQGNPTGESPQVGDVLIGHRDRDEGIYVGRPSLFGNPYSVESLGRTGAIAAYAAYLDETLKSPGNPLTRAVEGLAKRVARGEILTLICFCAPKACHGEVLRQVVLDRACELARHMHS